MRAIVNPQCWYNPATPLPRHLVFQGHRLTAGFPGVGGKPWFTERALPYLSRLTSATRMRRCLTLLRLVVRLVRPDRQNRRVYPRSTIPPTTEASSCSNGVLVGSHAQLRRGAFRHPGHDRARTPTLVKRLDRANSA